MSIVVATVSHAAPPLRWVRNLDDARLIAATENKDIFINFTGLEWCGHCVDLDDLILSRKEFVAASDNFVLVDMDFPSDRDELGPLKEPYHAWLKQYRVHGFPTVVLADAAGRPYTYFTGCDSGVDVAKFLSHLDSAKQARRKRDEELTAARAASDADRAQRLHAAIQSVAEALGSIEDREDDPVLAFYGDEVAEIRRLDADGALGLRAVYDARARALEQYQHRASILAQLDRYTAQEDCQAVIAHIDRLLTEVADANLRFRLKQRRYAFLDWNKQYAEAHELAVQLAHDPACPADDRDRMLRNGAICLSRLGRLDDAVAFYDKQIEASQERSESRLYFVTWKASMLLSTDRHEQAIAACREYRAAAHPNSRDWAMATSYMAFALTKAGRHREVIEVWRDRLEHRPDDAPRAFFLISMARSQHALGLDVDARRTLDEAEQAIPARVDRPAKQKELDELREELRKVRELVAQPSAK